MKIVEIIGNLVHHVYDEYNDLASARRCFAGNIHLEEAPDDTFEGWIFDSSKTGEERFARPPIPPGWAWGEGGAPYNPETLRSSEREAKHAETTNDTMQALRKIREGDTTIDWSAWLEELDAYNVAIEKTKEQADYPLKVTYPEYPTKPTR